MFPISANPSDFAHKPARSLPPTLPPSPPSAESAGVLITPLHYAKKWHRCALSALSSTTVLPTDVLTKAAQKDVLTSLE